ncbi:MAG: hypothetical protein VB070_05425 [Clostridiaceae bacterium]|nr:hypothetical protein [Clostridiaceae bacterium]
MKKLNFPVETVGEDFPGFSHQDVQEQVRRMLQNLECGVNPFSGQPYDYWDAYRHTFDDVEEVRQQMLKYCCDY